MTLILIVLLILVGGGVWFVVSTYNNLISLIKQVENAKEISKFYSKEHVYKMWKEFYTEIAKKKKKEKKKKKKSE